MLGRSGKQWVLALVLAAAGGAAAVVKALGWEHVTWLAITVAVLAPVLAIPAKVYAGVVEDRAKRRFGNQEALEAGAVGGGRRRVCDVADPTAWGVHRAGLPDTMTAAMDAAEVPEGMPVYVRRDQHEAVAARLVAGKFTVVLGDSGAGKSRLAFEVLQATVGNHVLFAPEPPALAAAIEQMRGIDLAVLWLDDLERFLDTDTLTATAVTELLAGAGHERMIVATLRHEARADLLATGKGVERAVADRRQRVLDLADPVLITRAFTTTELDRAREHRHDSRIADALTHAGSYGLAEYLAAGPQLRDKWLAGKDTNPRGAALVTAAVECRRAGYIAPLPRTLLNQVHVHYVPSSPHIRLDDLDSAWEWATEWFRRTTALLVSANTDEDSVVVFDYLLDHMQRTTPVDQDPRHDVVLAALDYADATTATAIGNRAHARGRYALAHTAYARALALRAEAFGVEDPATLTSRHNLATVLHDRGKLDEAEQELRAVLTSVSHTLDVDHATALASRHNLALVLRDRGKLDEAEEELRAVLAVRIHTLGANHPTALSSRHNLALVLRDRGKLDEAEEELRAVLAVRIHTLGEDHPSTLTTRNNLATVLHDQGKLDEVENEFRAMLATRTHELGPDHPITLTSRNNLAGVLHDQGKLDEAERESRAVLSALTRTLAADHPITLTSRHNLALVLRDQGKLDEAEEELRAVLAVRIQTLGDAHPTTRTSRNTLTAVLRDQGKLNEADRNE